MITCSTSIKMRSLQPIFRGMCFDPETKLIYRSMCDSSTPIGKSINGKIKWFKL